MGLMGALSSELRSWIVPGRAGALAIIDARGEPCIARIWAARAHGASDVIEIYLQRGSATSLLEALDAPRRGALNLIEVNTYRSRTFKGPCELSREPVDVPFSDASVDAVGRVFHSVGMPVDAAPLMLGHAEEGRDMVAVCLTVETVFDQSPKPGAGAPL